MDNRQLTREGNQVFSSECMIRLGMRRCGTLCAECIHAADACKKINKSSTIVKGFRVITSSDGFEEIGKRVEG